MLSAVSVGRTSELRVYRVSNGELVARSAIPGNGCVLTLRFAGVSRHASGQMRSAMLMTGGTNDMKVWELDTRRAALSFKSASFSERDSKKRRVVTASVHQDGYFITGHDDGSISKWSGTKHLFTVNAKADGVTSLAVWGQYHANGNARNSATSLLSGHECGDVIVWDESLTCKTTYTARDIQAELKCGPLGAVRSVDVGPAGEKIVIAYSSGSIIEGWTVFGQEINHGRAWTLVNSGHDQCTSSTCITVTHPTKPLAYTACSREVKTLNLRSHKAEAEETLEEKCSAIAVSPVANQVIVGSESGKVYVRNWLLKPISETSCGFSKVTFLQYSPDGARVAVGIIFSKVYILYTSLYAIACEFRSPGDLLQPLIGLQIPNTCVLPAIWTS